ncbi:MAG TPA: hypothetical protein PKY73_08285 [Hyphomonas sp.]|nr:hypothetical protein [Hyphomonas sp.]
MAYNAKDLSVLAYANGFTLWHYKTDDAAGAVDTQNYFNDAADVFRAGDMILANTGNGGSVAAGLFLVSNADAGSVDVHDLLPVGAVNTD